MQLDSRYWYRSSERILRTNSTQPSHFLFPGHFKKKKDLISNNEVLSDPNKQQSRTQEWTKTGSCHYQFFKERWGERWTDPDRLDADKLQWRGPSFLTRQEGGEQHWCPALTSLGVEVRRETPDTLSGFSLRVKLSVFWVRVKLSNVASEQFVQKVFACCVCFREHVSISQIFF